MKRNEKEEKREKKEENKLCNKVKSSNGDIRIF